MVAIHRPERDDPREAIRRDIIATRMLPLCAQWTIVSIRGPVHNVIETQHNPHAAATLAYAYADAMIAVRGAE